MNILVATPNGKGVRGHIGLKGLMRRIGLMKKEGEQMAVLSHFHEKCGLPRMKMMKL